MAGRPFARTPPCAGRERDSAPLRGVGCAADRRGRRRGLPAGVSDPRTGRHLRDRVRRTCQSPRHRASHDRAALPLAKRVRRKMGRHTTPRVARSCDCPREASSAPPAPGARGLLQRRSTAHVAPGRCASRAPSRTAERRQSRRTFPGRRPPPSILESSLIAPHTFFATMTRRAPRSGREDRSRRVRASGPHPVARHSRKGCAAGGSPVKLLKLIGIGGVAEWSKAPVLKSQLGTITKWSKWTLRTPREQTLISVCSRAWDNARGVWRGH